MSKKNSTSPMLVLIGQIKGENVPNNFRSFRNELYRVLLDLGKKFPCHILSSHAIVDRVYVSFIISALQIYWFLESLVRSSNWRQCPVKIFCPWSRCQSLPFLSIAGSFNIWAGWNLAKRVKITSSLTNSKKHSLSLKWELRKSLKWNVVHLMYLVSPRGSV